jgi:hypothetical protein
MRMGSFGDRLKAANVFRRKAVDHQLLVKALIRVRTFRTDLDSHHCSVP